MNPVLPPGEQFELAHGAYRAIVVEVGAGLRILEANGRPLVQGYDSAAICDSARGQLLLPWPNRIEDASYRFDGIDRKLPVTERGSGCAIHGLTRWANWHCKEHTTDRVALSHRLHPQPGWPGTLELTATYQLGDAGLAVTIVAHNVGVVDLPFGAGAHPYLVVGDGPIDDWTLTLDAATVMLTDDRGLPSATQGVVDSRFDFRPGRRIGRTMLDNPFTDLSRDRDGRIRAHLSEPDGHTVSVWADEHHGWFQVFTGDHLGDPARRRMAVAIEPMTCPPNAFRTGDDLVVLHPDEKVAISWGIQAD